MRSELNVTHSKKWKAEACGSDHRIAFVSWWLLRCHVVTWPGCWNRVTWLDDLPVDGREGVPSPVSVQGGALPGDVDGFRYPPAEPILVAHWRGAAVVLRNTFMEAPLSLTYVCGITVWTLDLVHYTRPLVLGNFVLGVYQAAPGWCCKVWGARTLPLCGWFCR